MQRQYPQYPFERYADEGLAHGQTEVRGLARSAPEIVGGLVASLAQESSAVYCGSGTGVVRALKDGTGTTPIADYPAPPLLGAHTREVMAERLHFSAAQIDSLAARHVV